jgi:hypothetical protein
MGGFSLKTIYHKSLTVENWSTKPYEYQILTIGAEMGRAKNMASKGHTEEARRAIERAMELLDLTIYDFKWSNKLRELLRFREWIGIFYLEPVKNLEVCLHLYKTLLQWHPKTAMVEI